MVRKDELVARRSFRMDEHLYTALTAMAMAAGCSVQDLIEALIDHAWTDHSLADVHGWINGSDEVEG